MIAESPKSTAWQRLWPPRRLSGEPSREGSGGRRHAIFTGPPPEPTRVTRPSPRGGAVMKLLFAIRNRVAANKSLKANAWYLWY
ncbi:tryptorubin family RiPP precursor [Streptomyces echinatus]|uniref:tryptorubin family RiPP precursor n=1 Tax=Streptomyces echinatus TaxID=67293 RepID=UPI0037891B7A